MYKELQWLPYLLNQQTPHNFLSYHDKITVVPRLSEPQLIEPSVIQTLQRPHFIINIIIIYKMPDHL